MISISPIDDMPPDLYDLLKSKDQSFRGVTNYGIIATTGKFKDSVLVHALLTANALTKERLEFVPIEPGEWQPGAMRYIIYLIK